MKPEDRTKKTFGIKLKMILDKLRGKKIIILDIEETTFVPYILPIFNSLKKKPTRYHII